MGSSGHNLMRWFRGESGSHDTTVEKSRTTPRTRRHCIGLGELMRGLSSSGADKMSLLDLGPTSPANISFITNLGLRVYNEDVLRASQDCGYMAKQEDGSMQLDPGKFFSDNLGYPANHFDAILCWDVADYLPENLVKPLVERLQVMLKPKGNLLAFFHSKDAGPEAPHCRYHIVQPDTLEFEPGPVFRLQRIFNNRHIENLFKDFVSRKFFLGRDNIREVLMVR